MTAALIGLGVVLFLVVLFLLAALRVAREYERGVIFRLGRLLDPPKGPGLFLLIPVIDRMVKVDLRTITLNVPPQEVITKDNVPVRVNAVAYFRIVEPKNAIVQVENFMVATSQIAQTTLRSVLGQHMLDELLSERDKINAILQTIIDEATAPWGIKVSIVEVKDVEIPTGMQRAMARQAEAERERRAKVIAAEGEFQASERLKDAAAVIEEHPIALQLRYLQTLLELGPSASTTIVFPAPIDLFGPFIREARRAATSPERRPSSPRPAHRDGSSRSRRAARAGPAPSAGESSPPTGGGARRRARSARAARTARRPRCSRSGATGPRAGRAGLAGARRAEPLPGVRAAGGRRSTGRRTRARWPTSTTRCSTLVAEAWRLRARARRATGSRTCTRS